MSELERKTLARMLDPVDIATVAAAGMSSNAFEDLTCRAAYDWMIEHWQKNTMPPTRAMMDHEFPVVKLDVEADEPVGWLVATLQERHTVNRAQDVMMDAANTLDADPVASVAQLRDALTLLLDEAGLAVSDGAPKLWAADDLRAAAQPRWLAKNRLPRGAVSLLVGDEGIGKSLFWVYLAAAITTGKPLPEFGITARDPAHVVVVVTEDDWSTTVRPRLEVSGADLTMVRVICAEEDGSGAPEFPRDLPLVANADPVPALVVVDAWLDTVPARFDVRNPQAARQALHPWREVAITTDAAVLLLTHTNRVNSANVRDKYGATGELRKKARMTLFAQRDDDGNLVIGPDKANTAASITASSFRVRAVQRFNATEDHDGTVPLLTYVGEAEHTAQQLVAQAHALGHGSGVRDEVVMWLVAALSNGPRWASDLNDEARGAGFSVDQLKRNKRRAGAESVRDGQSNAWFWRLQGQGVAPESDQESAGVSA